MEFLKTDKLLDTLNIQQVQIEEEGELRRQNTALKVLCKQLEKRISQRVTEYIRNVKVKRTERSKQEGGGVKQCKPLRKGDT